MDDYKYRYLDGPTEIQVKTGRGTLHSIVVGRSGASEVQVFDATPSGTSTTIAWLKASVTEGTYLFDCTFATGLRVLVGGESNITIVYR